MILIDKDATERKIYIEAALLKLKQLKGIELTLDYYEPTVDAGAFYDPQLGIAYDIITLAFTDPMGIHVNFRAVISSDLFSPYPRKEDPKFDASLGDVPIDQLIIIRLTKAIFMVWKDIMKERGYDPSIFTTKRVDVVIDPTAIDPTLNCASPSLNKVVLSGATVSRLDTLSDVLTDTRQEFEDKLQQAQDENNKLKDEIDKLKALTDLLIDKCSEKGII